MSIVIAVQDGHVIQCPDCYRLMDNVGQIAYRCEGLVAHALHVPCPTCTLKALDKRKSN